MESILAAHPLVAVVWECGLFDSPGGLAALMAERHWNPEGNGLITLMTREELAREIRVFASRIFARRVWPGHRYLVEKTPGHLWQMRFISEIFPGARFIHVLRDGRDVWVSTRAAKRSWAREWRGRRRFTLPGTAHLWQRAVLQVADDRQALGDRLLEMRFEEIKRDPLSEIRRIFEFCRIPCDDDALKRIHEETDFDRRHRPDEAAFLRGGRVGDWRTHLNLIDGLIFNTVAGRALVAAGYERNRLWFAPPWRRVRPPRRT